VIGHTRLRVGDRLSSDTYLVSGVIQGSSVGPVAFLMQAKLLDSSVVEVTFIK